MASYPKRLTRMKRLFMLTHFQVSFLRVRFFFIVAFEKFMTYVNNCDSVLQVVHSWIVRT